MTTTLTRPSLADELQPFVGAKLRRDDARTHRIDITHGVTRSINADLRSIDQDGIDLFFYRDCDHVRWPDIVEIKLFALDPKTGSPLSCRKFDRAAIQHAFRGDRL